MVIKKPNTHTTGLSSLLRHIQDPFPFIQTTTCVSLKTRLKHFCYLKLATHLRSKKLANKKQKIFSEKQKRKRKEKEKKNVTRQ